MKLYIGVLLSAVFLFLSFGQACADDADLYTVNVAPDALLLLDLSGSMRWTPAGETMYIGTSQTCGTDVAYYPTSGSGHTKPCMIDAYGPVPRYGNDVSCSGPFYENSGPGHTEDCSRFAIAKRAIFKLLDDNGDNTINADDRSRLGIRFGYMRFKDGNDAGGNYSSGYNKLINGIDTPYITIWSSVSGEGAPNSGTPLAASLNEAKSYFDSHKSSDPGKDCRKKFVILVTDGSDTYACGGNGSEDQSDQYKRRRETVAKAKALLDAGYYVFVVGFGAAMPHYLRNTLNWAAYYGKTDNPNDPNSGNPPNGYNVPSTGLYPSGINGCPSSSSTSHHNLGDGDHYYATSNDPGEVDLGGYAFIATNPSELTAALKTIAKYIQELSYSFSVPAISIVRILDQEIGYISSFIPNVTSIWRGDIVAYQLDANGLLVPIEANKIWSAFEKLNSLAPNVRNIYTTLDNKNRTVFGYNELSNDDLGVSSDTERAKLINHIRGTDTYDLDHDSNTTESREWKLEDIIHSNPIIVGEPSRYFVDEGYSGSGGFYEANKNRTKIIIVGANDGMLHAFNANADPSDVNRGKEVWAVIPNSLLKKLKEKISAHGYYVDSSPKVADVWFGDGNGNGRKDPSEWKTVLVCGLRKGGEHYFALDITHTLDPQFLWEFPHPGDPQIPNYQDFLDNKIGQSWSEPAIGRVKINSLEQWVAFIGGGFDSTNGRGRAFFVIDIKTGNLIKEFSGLSGMTYSLAAPPSAVDLNGDGFIDNVYIGDLGGQMWVFDVSSNNINQWTGQQLFISPIESSGKHPIYYPPAVALDNRDHKPWVYFGTGDRENPNSRDIPDPPRERIYAVKDDGRGTYPRTEANLLDVTLLNTFNPVNTFSSPTQPNPSKGWYLQLGKSGQSTEKVLAKPALFNRLVYFTTYTNTITSNPCLVAGDAKLYIVEYLSGGGAVSTLGDYTIPSTSSDRSVSIGGSGSGVPSAPVISVDMRGKGSVVVGTTTGQVLSQKTFSPSSGSKEIIYWREVTP